MSATSTLFWTFFDLCRLRLGPQDLPVSPVLLRASLLAYGVCGFVSALIGLSPVWALAGTLLDVALLALLTGVALGLRRRPERYTQTLTALAGSGTVLGLISLPIVTALGLAPDGPLQLLLSNLWLLLLVWNLVVIGHIARHALDLGMPAGLGVALVYFMILLGAYSLLPSGAGG